MATWLAASAVVAAVAGACSGSVTGAAPTSAPVEPATTHGPAEPACPRFGDGERVGEVRDPSLSELSGLAASRRNRGILWVQEDSGNPADLVALHQEGTVVRTYHLDGVKARDWEDLAVGPGPGSGGDDGAGASFVYIGDIGDNTGDQKSLRAVRVPEPAVPATGSTGGTATIGDAVTLTARYPDGSHDAETLMSDPRTGDLYVVTKSDKGASGVYRWAAPQPPTGTATLERVATIEVGQLDGALDRRVTGGDISPDGSEILLRTYTSAWVWERGEEESVADALDAVPCSVPLQLDRQGEAIAWSADASAYLTTTEGPRPPIVRFDREGH